MKQSLLNKYYGNNRAAKVIYGTILIFVFLIGLGHSNITSSVELAIKTFIAALTIVFAEIYSEIIGFTIKNKGPLSRDERKEVYEDSFAIASTSFWPSIILLFSATGIYSVTTALYVGYLFCLVTLVAFSYWAARLGKSSKLKSFMFAFVTAGIGIIIISLKYAFGH